MFMLLTSTLQHVSLLEDRHKGPSKTKCTMNQIKKVKTKQNNPKAVFISDITQTVRYRTPVFTQPFPWRLHITITYNLPHLRL
jgi:hypothetical protein